MEERNEFFRRLNLQFVPSTDGIPNYYLSTVKMLSRAFPGGMEIGDANYMALCVFLDQEEFPYRAIAQILDFTFDLGYANVLNSLGYIENDEQRLREMERIEKLFTPLGLQGWRMEIAAENGRSFE